MNNKIKQYNLINTLPINGLRETVSDKFECKCIIPDCQKENDSRKKAGFFWSDKSSSYVYHCFKCGAAMKLSYFLKIYFKDYYLNNFFNRNSRSYTKTKTNCVSSSSSTIASVKIANTHVKELVNNLFEQKLLIPYAKCKDPDVQRYLLQRKIPLMRYDNFYLAKNFFNINQQIKTLMNEKGKVFEPQNLDDKRLVWMFKNRTNEIIALQGRKLEKGEPRYMISKFGGNDRIIGNLENIDINNTVYVTEGYIDSLFLPNAVSLQGLHMPSIIYLLKELKVKELIIVFDNENNNEQIQMNIKTLAELSFKYENLKVCLFPKELRAIGKDINDYIVKGNYSTDMILHTINNNSFTRSTLKVRGILW